MAALRLGLLFVLSGAILSGCAMSEEDKVVGNWTIDQTATMNANSGLPEVGQKFIDTSVLKIHADHTYQLIVVMSQKGKWELKENQLSLKPEGKGIPLTLILSKDGVHGEVEQQTPIGKFTLIFRKTG